MDGFEHRLAGFDHPRTLAERIFTGMGVVHDACTGATAAKTAEAATREEEMDVAERIERGRQWPQHRAGYSWRWTHVTDESLS